MTTFEHERRNTPSALCPSTSVPSFLATHPSKTRAMKTPRCSDRMALVQRTPADCEVPSTLSASQERAKKKAETELEGPNREKHTQTHSPTLPPRVNGDTIQHSHWQLRYTHPPPSNKYKKNLQAVLYVQDVDRNGWECHQETCQKVSRFSKHFDSKVPRQSKYLCVSLSVILLLFLRSQDQHSRFSWLALQLACKSTPTIGRQATCIPSSNSQHPFWLVQATDTARHTKQVSTSFSSRSPILF